MSNVQRRITFATLWILLITILSFLPEPLKSNFHTRGPFHRWAHLLAFFSIVLLLVRAAQNQRQRILLFLMALAFGFCLELAQHAVYSTAIEWGDIAVDALGSSLGWLLALALDTPLQPEDQ